ncbi:hypothetical protein M3A49_38255 [Paraburkholderia sp. CNPSo 3076]|uniref:hypothetical protein n=1 Tax=Paraburkholderia sp. CNPSo 3076 TaxID=2940936 RepID=UPI0022512F25|nr:hypothetical protein [Paraburkholderia sp. CNPSo 3076]MCX5545223.1 hypothetical protein [Paraburkholderia sp. CNPSo 3076]
MPQHFLAALAGILRRLDCPDEVELNHTCFGIVSLDLGVTVLELPMTIRACDWHVARIDETTCGQSLDVVRFRVRSALRIQRNDRNTGTRQQ